MRQKGGLRAGVGLKSKSQTKDEDHQAAKGCQTDEDVSYAQIQHGFWLSLAA
jgi:hypothetical protein